MDADDFDFALPSDIRPGDPAAHSQADAASDQHAAVEGKGRIADEQGAKVSARPRRAPPPQRKVELRAGDTPVEPAFELTPPPSSDSELDPHPMVRQDRSTIVANGVFSLTEQVMDAWHCYSDKTVYVHLQAPSTLQPIDLKVLVAVAKAGFSDYRAKNGKQAVTPGDPRDISLRLELQGSTPVNVTEYWTSLRELAFQSGLSRNSRDGGAIFASLQRLANVSIWTYHLAPENTPIHLTRKVEKTIRGVPHVFRCLNIEHSRLLSSVAVRGNGGLRVALNPRQTAALLGLSNQFTLVQPEEMKVLRTSVGPLLLGRLCGWIDPGTTRKVSTARLEQYVWVQLISRPRRRHGPMPKELIERRRIIRRGMHEIRDKLGWTVTETPNDCWVISRPSTSPLIAGMPGSQDPMDIAEDYEATDD